MKVLFQALSLVFLLLSCTQPKSCETRNGSEFAEHFSIQSENGFSLLSINNPWQESSGVSVSYVLGDNPLRIPDSLKDLTFIKTPVENVIVFSTTHIGFISVLNKTGGIQAASGCDYICNSEVRNRLAGDEVFEIGFAPNIDYEKIIEISPDLVFLYGIESSVAGISERLVDLGIPTVLIAEYLERHPLGKAEWLKVFGELYKKRQQADSIFSQIKNEYIKTANRVPEDKDKPSVFVGLPWKEVWFMAGGKSHTAQLIKDAGGDYLWSENDSDETLPLSMEGVLTRAIDADIWLNTGSASAIADIISTDSRLASFQAMKNKEVFNNNAIMCESGGNAFWEKGVVEPQIILKDLIKIFHPEILPSHDLVYYRKLE